MQLLKNGCENLSVVGISISNDQIKVVAKNKYAKFFACELWVKRVGTFGVVLYRNQCPVNFILYFAKLYIGSSIKYKNTLFKIVISNIILSKELKYPSLFF